MLNAFCRVAPSVLLNFFAILAAAVFFFAMLFNSRTSVAVHARRFFDFLAINPPFQERQLHLINRGERNTTDRFEGICKAVFDPNNTRRQVGSATMSIVR
jgi:hypothetical protein